MGVWCELQTTGAGGRAAARRAFVPSRLALGVARAARARVIASRVDTFCGDLSDWIVDLASARRSARARGSLIEFARFIDWSPGVAPSNPWTWRCPFPYIAALEERRLR